MVGRGVRRSASAPALLGAGAFVVGTCELVLAGLLPELARSLQVTVVRAGQAVTVFDLAATISGPLLAAATVRWDRRAVLLLALGSYLTGTAVSGVAGSFGLLLVAQVLAACGAGLFLPTATVAAAAITGPERQGRAVATVTTGMTVAIAVGAPLGTALAALAGCGRRWPRCRRWRSWQRSRSSRGSRQFERATTRRWDCASGCRRSSTAECSRSSEPPWSRSPRSTSPTPTSQSWSPTPPEGADCGGRCSCPSSESRGSSATSWPAASRTGSEDVPSSPEHWSDSRSCSC
ncbi:MFS transporter [Saccharopolyspora rhizosphaerae]|uniref:MFS transporter n=1 Tax=Saccharopolyspora rhizosphaerae TaxID=2492662 RepID=A0A3R8NTU8_9PSEU|nr:MFS transporter [Saccharopolyspora rhizosphaerae]